MRSFVFSISIVFLFVCVVAAPTQISAQETDNSDIAIQLNLLERVVALISTAMRAQVSSATTPDLIPFTVGRTPSGAIAVGESVIFHAVVQNIGGPKNQNYTIAPTRFCIDNTNCQDNNTGMISGGGVVVPDSGMSVSINSTAWTAIAGDHTLRFCIDVTRWVPETNDDNNCHTISFTVGSTSSSGSETQTSTAKPDLVGVVLSYSPRSPIIEGQVMQFSGNVKNNGTVAAPDSWARFCIDNANCLNSRDGQLLPGYQLSASGAPLPAGTASVPTTRTWTAVKGTHTIYLCADSAFQVDEGDKEGNNCASAQFTVSEAAPTSKPDLTAVNLIRSPFATITEGQVVQFSGSVKNIGGADASDSWARFCIDNPNCQTSITGQLLPAYRLSASGAPLKPNEISVPTTRSWTATKGQHTLYLCADFAAQVDEGTNESNNCATMQFTVGSTSPASETQTSTAKPDLVGVIQSYTPFTNIIEGQVMEFIGLVQNLGTVAAPDSWARFCIDNANCLNSRDGQLLPGYQLSASGAPLPARSSSVPTTRSWTAVKGTHTLYLCADSAFQVDEGTNESNNCVSRQFTVVEATPKQFGTGIPITQTGTQTATTTNTQTDTSDEEEAVRSELSIDSVQRLGDTPTVGTPITLIATVRNIEGSPEPFYVRFCLDDDDCLTKDRRRINDDQLVQNIGVGHVVVSTIWTPTEAKKYKINFCVDVTNVVSEDKEGKRNNCKKVEFTVVAPSQSTSAQRESTQPVTQSSTTQGTQTNTTTTTTNTQTNTNTQTTTQTDTHVATSATTCSVQAISDTQARGLGLDPAHDKYCDYKGMRFAAAGVVPDTAIQEAVRLAAGMLANRADVFPIMNGKGHRVLVIGKNQDLTDIPEYRNLYTQFPGTDWNARARGLGATDFMPYSSSGEENLMCHTSGDRYRGESIFVHEFAHSVLNLGLGDAFINRVRQAHTVALNAGLWGNTYARTNHEEYWAEGVQSFFNTNTQANPANGIHNYVNTKAELRAYDLNLYNLINEAFAGTSFNYSCP